MMILKPYIQKYVETEQAILIKNDRKIINKLYIHDTELTMFQKLRQDMDIGKKAMICVDT